MEKDASIMKDLDDTRAEMEAANADKLAAENAASATQAATTARPPAPSCGPCWPADRGSIDSLWGGS